MIKKVFKIIKNLIIVGIVIAVIVAIADKAGIIKHKNKEYLIEDFYDLSDYEEDLKGEESDITGMSKYDKYKMGLNPDDGSDTDFDGLSDKDEIEVYHSDPLKNSTSGDFYSDGYKVEHGMDLNTFYEYQNDLAMNGNACPEVTLTPSTSFDFNAVVADYTGSGMYNLADKEIIKTYSIHAFGGNIAIDLAQTGCDMEEINVYVNLFTGDEAKAVKFTVDGTKITLNENIEAGSYVIYIVKEKPGKKNKKATITFGSAVDENGEIEGGYGVLYGWFTNLKIKYVKTENEEIGENAKQRLIDAANEILSERRATISEKDIIATTKEDVDNTIKASKILPTLREPFPLIVEYKGHVDDFYAYGGVYTWYVYNEDVFETNAASGGTSASSSGIKNTTFAGGFNPNVDTLTFPNFGTEISNGGVCAGIAHLTSSLFNNGTLTLTSDTFEYDEKTYSFDITQDAENSTLLDRGLADYKTSSFVKKHENRDGILNKKLSNGEKDFATMISRYWQIGNASFNYKEVAKGYAGRDGDAGDVVARNCYDGTVVRSIVEQLDNGRICDAYFIVVDRSLKTVKDANGNKNIPGSGHAVNIYGYQRFQPNTEGAEGYLFYVYDNNYPGIVGTLSCEITHWGKLEVLNYYLDIPGSSYMATSSMSAMTNVGALNMFVVLDSEFNVLPN